MAYIFSALWINVNYSQFEVPIARVIEQLVDSVVVAIDSIPEIEIFPIRANLFVDSSGLDLNSILDSLEKLNLHIIVAKRQNYETHLVLF